MERAQVPWFKDRGCYVTTPSGVHRTWPPKLTAKEKASFDVEKETQTLYELNLEIRQERLFLMEPKSDAFVEFTNRAIFWWLMTGGWDRLKAIRERYDAHFAIELAFIGSRLPPIPKIEASKKETCDNQAKQASTGQASKAQKTPTKEPFDIGTATHVLFWVARSGARAPFFDPITLAVFEQFANIWWEETGSLQNVDKAILAPYPDWFLERLALVGLERHLDKISKKGTENETKFGVEKNTQAPENETNFDVKKNTQAPENETKFDVKKNTQALENETKFDVEKNTRDLFEMAKKRFPNAPRGMDFKNDSSQLHKEFDHRVIIWYERTGGWRNMDKAIRDSYPSWFVDRLAWYEKMLPVAKMMAFDSWTGCTI